MGEKETVKRNIRITYYRDTEHHYLYGLKEYECGRMMMKTYVQVGANHYKDTGGAWISVKQGEVTDLLSNCTKVSVEEVMYVL